MSGFLLDLAANIVAGVLTTGAIAGIAYLWKIRPHLRATEAHRQAQRREWQLAAEHREDVTAWIEGLHERFDSAGYPDVHEPADEPGRHHVDAVDTGVMQAVTKP